MQWLMRLILRYPGWVLLLSVLLTALSVRPTIRLYSNLRPDIQELLPKKSRSVVDLDKIRARLQSIENLGVLVFSDHPAASRRFVDDLVARVGELPPTVTSGVEYNIRNELEFFSRRKALFVEPGDLRKIRDYIDDKIEYEKQLYNPLNIFSEVDVPEPSLDFHGMITRYEGQASGFSRYPGGYYATPDEKMRAVLVYLPGKSGIKGNQLLKDSVARIVEDLKPTSYAPDLRVQYTGGVQNTIEEYSALVGDIERSATVVTVVITASLIIYFRSVIGVVALFISLFMARFWTFAFSWFSIGYLNANSGFMGSIVLGSGITYGIMLLSRYLEERRAGRVPLRAARISIHATVYATWTAALAAALAYGSLTLTEFEGFRQYGIIGFVAMILCWLSSIVVFPVLLLLAERVRPLVRGKPKPRPSWIFGPVANFLGRFPVPVLVATLIITGASVFYAFRFDPERIIETDLSKLRNKESLERGSGYWSKYQDQIFRQYLSPVVVLAHTEKDAEKIAIALESQRKAEGKQSLMTSVRSIRDFVPARQSEKVRLMREIETLLPPRILHRMSPEDRAQVRKFLTPEAKKGFDKKDLPPLVLKKFTESDGTLGKLVLVEPPLGSKLWSADQLNRFVADTRRVADEISLKSGNPQVPVAGNLPVVSDMISAIGRDGPKATIFAFISVIILVLVLFRRPSVSFMILGALFLGNFWMFGFAMALGVKINFLNFIALPITFGIGVDYGVNIFERYLSDPKRDVLKVVRETGSAVTLCSFTTVVGYSSLLLAGNQAFVSFGLLAVAGELGTMLAAVMMLPTILILKDRRQARRAAAA